jgi:hypothetical protein
MIMCLCLLTNIQAQSVLSGTVYANTDQVPLSNVLVRNISNKQVTITGKTGAFKITAALNNFLVFKLPGYVTDTLFITDLTQKKIKLLSFGRALNEVKITSNNTPEVFDPEKEYPGVYEKSKFALSPSRLLGKDARDARRLKRYFDNEKKQQKIDSIFNKQFVGNLLPLKGHDLNNFMVLYRPRLSFLNKSSPTTLALYVNDCYKKFVKLPPRKKSMPGLY